MAKKKAFIPLLCLTSIVFPLGASFLHLRKVWNLRLSIGGILNNPKLIDSSTNS